MTSTQLANKIIEKQQRENEPKWIAYQITLSNKLVEIDAGGNLHWVVKNDDDV